MSDKTREALAGMLAIVDESRGVDGYHLNGDTAEWDEFPEVAAARAALAQQPAPAAQVTQEPAAWQDPENLDRICSARTMREAKRTGGATLSALKPLTRPLYTAPPAAEQPDTVAVPRELLGGLRELCEYWFTREDTRGISESDFKTWHALGFGSKAFTELRALLAGGAE